MPHSSASARSPLGDEEPAPPRRGRAVSTSDYFAPQRTTSARLPDPEPLAVNLTRCVIEVLAGVRELDQLARWVTDEVYTHLLRRAVLAKRARDITSRSSQRPQFSIGTTIVTQPCDGVAEIVVIVHQKVRSRAVALRLEGLDNRWRASAINVL